ncbi:YutD family protein [Levilactobacillus zymae]|uniref:YutD family protein n=1 Tax=Levilactobacillus zymae TaxID=267363 RepID=UPI003FCDEA65
MVDRKDLEALVAQQREKREPSAEVLRVDETHLKINGHAYELVTNVREGFDFAEFAQRYSTILSKYDYIVGDWGFEQLRLKGFYAADRAGAKQNQIDAVQDYLYESCNFGCAYFILHNLEVKPAPKPRRNRSRRHNGNNGANPTNAKAEKATTAATPKSTSGHNGPRRHRSRHSRRRNNSNNHSFTEERRTTPTAPKPTKTVTVASGGGQGRRHFTIRQKKEE